MIARAYLSVARAVALWWAWVCERARMRLSAALMDAGCYLALDPVERRARKVRRKLLGRKGRRLGPHGALVAMGAGEIAGEAALVIGRRAVSGDGRTLALLCVAVEEDRAAPADARPYPDGDPDGDPEEDPGAGPSFYWGVRWEPAPGAPGGARTSMLSERDGALETALVAFFADPVPAALGGLSRSEPHEPPGEAGGVRDPSARVA